MLATAMHDLMARKVLNGEKLRLLREERGWSLADVVFQAAQRKYRISNQTIRDVETGKSDGTIRTLSILAAVYEVEDLDSLFVVEN